MLKARLKRPLPQSSLGTQQHVPPPSGEVGPEKVATSTALEWGRAPQKAVTNWHQTPRRRQPGWCLRGAGPYPYAHSRNAARRQAVTPNLPPRMVLPSCSAP